MINTFLTRLEVEDMTEGKRKHVSLSIEEKLTVLKKIAGGASLASIAKEYGITLDSYFYTETYSTFTHTVL